MKDNSCLYKLGFLFSLLMGVLFWDFNYRAFAEELILPSSIIKLPENETAILVEKKTQQLFVYTSNGKKWHVQFQMDCSTGEMPGDKLISGDKKTPEGIYFLKDEYEDRYLSAIYGKKAFPTDYPNFMDKRLGKTGSAIWIHGTNKKLVPMDSNGCVALENSNILKLSDYINLDSTPVIMAENIEPIERTARIEKEQDILTLLSQWNKAFEKGSYHDYLSFYSPGYLPDISWWEPWVEIRKQADKPESDPEPDSGSDYEPEPNSELESTFVSASDSEFVSDTSLESDISLDSDTSLESGTEPGSSSDSGLSRKMDRTGIYYHNRVFVVLFDCFLTLNTETVYLGKRKLFLENKNNHYKIIGDVFQSVPKKLQETENPFLAVAKKLVMPASKTKAVEPSTE